VTIDSIVTVIEKATTRDLTTLEAAKEELNILGNDFDMRLARWITETSKYIERWCNRTLALETVSEQWRASDQRAHGWLGWFGSTGAPVSIADARPLVAQRWPVVKVTSITEDQNDPLLTTDYEVDARTGRIWRLSGGARSHWYAGVVTVVYSGGFFVPRDVPPDLQQGCLMLLQIRNDGNTRDRMLRSQVIPGVLEEQFWNPSGSGAATQAMPPEIADVLQPYREYNA
jgi:hypothetical protein